MKFLITILSVVVCATAGADEVPVWAQMQRAVLFEKDLDKIRELVKSGVDPNAPIGCGTFAPLDGAMGNPEMVDVLLSLGAKPLDRHLVSAAFGDSHEDSLKIVKSLLAAGVSVNAKECYMNDENRYSQAIHKAVWRENRELIAFLLEQEGIELNNVNLDGYTPLMIAVEHGEEDIVDMLLAVGADPRKKNDKGLDATGVADEQIALRERMKAKFQAAPTARTVTTGEALPAAQRP